MSDTISQPKADDYSNYPEYEPPWLDQATYDPEACELQDPTPALRRMFEVWRKPPKGPLKWPGASGSHGDAVDSDGARLPKR